MSQAITEAMVEAALSAYREGIYLTDEQVLSSVTKIVSAALSAGQAQPVAIKPLEWRDHPIFGGDDLAIANIAEWGEHGHKYQVGRDADAPGYKAFLAPMHGSWFWTSPGHATLEAAKAAAQKDFEARIRSALIGGGA